MMPMITPKLGYLGQPLIVDVVDSSGRNPFFEVYRWYRLLKIVDAWKPDIVHSHLPRADLATSVVHAFCSNPKWICTIYDAYVKKVYSGHWIFKFLAWNWRRADHLQAVSGHARKWAIKKLGVQPEKISVIYHGIKIDATDSRTAEKRADTESFHIGCLARYEPRKGIATLVRSMVHVCEKYPSARLMLAGSDPSGYSKQIRVLADNLGIGHAVDVQVFSDNPIEFLKALDVFAFASVSEGFGIVLLEAMSVGLPVVASDIYPINKIVGGCPR